MTEMIVNFVCHMSRNAFKTCHFELLNPWDADEGNSRQFCPIRSIFCVFWRRIWVKATAITFLLR